MQDQSWQRGHANNADRLPNASSRLDQRDSRGSSGSSTNTSSSSPYVSPYQSPDQTFNDRSKDAFPLETEENRYIFNDVMPYIESENTSPVNGSVTSSMDGFDQRSVDGFSEEDRGDDNDNNAEDNDASLPARPLPNSMHNSLANPPNNSLNGSTVSSHSKGGSNGADYKPAPPANFGQSLILNQIPRYVQLTVDQPQKVSDGSSSYVSYLVTAQQYPEEKPEKVRRRFSDFAKLYDKLSAEYPACAIPPLPDRRRLEYIAGDRFSTEFTTKRAASLERFLFRVSQHPSLRRSRGFVLFLSKDVGGGGLSGGPMSSKASQSSTTFRNNGSNSVTTTATGAGVQPGLNGSQQSSAALVALDQLSETLMNAFSKARHQSKEMIDARERADRYEQNIATIDKSVVRTSKTHSELALDLEDMHHQALKLAKLEPQSAAEFTLLGRTAHTLSGATAQLKGGIDSHFGCALRDMSHYIQALKGMLKQREQRQIDYEALIEYLKRSEHELVAAEHGQNAPAFSSSFLRTKFNELRGVDNEYARQQRISKLKARITEFKDESAKAKQVSDDFEELAKQEVRVFDQTEAIELQQSLAGLSDNYIEFYQNVLRKCRDLEASLGQG